MMLMLEKWNRASKDLEQAALLDEAPYYKYRATEAGEPWRPDSALTAAARSVDLEGFAWLYVVYRSDDAETWGSKRVKIMAGGRILRAEMTDSGVETGRFLAMRFEVLAPQLFHCAVRKTTKLSYRVAISAEMAIDPKVMKDPKRVAQFAEEPPDPVFGWIEKPVAKEESNRRQTIFAPPVDVGCVLSFVSDSGQLDRWFLHDATGLAEFRFELTEYQRRPFVQIILSRLGFVRDPALEAAGEPPSLEQASSGLVRNLSTTLNSLLGMIAWHDKTNSH